MTRTTRGWLAGLAMVALSSASPAAPAKMTVPFLQDDYARALAEARARHVPIFVEAWAPW